MLTAFHFRQEIIAFSREVSNLAETRKVLVEMVHQARQRRAISPRKMSWPEILKPWQRGLAQLYRISRQFVSATFQRRYKGHRRGTIINLSDPHRQRVGSVSLHGHIDTIFTPVCGGG